jgi:hypothetical protein
MSVETSEESEMLDILSSLSKDEACEDFGISHTETDSSESICCAPAIGVSSMDESTTTEVFGNCCTFKTEFVLSSGAERLADLLMSVEVTCVGGFTYDRALVLLRWLAICLSVTRTWIHYGSVATAKSFRIFSGNAPLEESPTEPSGTTDCCSGM